MLMRSDALEAAGRWTTYPAYGRIFLIALPFWASIVTITSLSAVVRGYVYWWVNVPLDAALILYAALVSVGVYAILRRITDLPFWRQLAISFLIVFSIAFPFEAGFNVMRTFAGPDAEKLTLANVFVRKNMITGGLFWIVPWSLWAAALLAMLHNIESRRRERRLATAQREAHEAQVRALRYQVNPHFLYNTLSSVSTLILEGQSAVAERMVMQLSAFFRASLAQDPFHDVRLADELELQRLYLEIEKMRFADSLSVEYDIPANLSDALVPSLILQPLVENSIKHGLQEAGKVTTLSLSARAVRDRLVLEVADDGPANVTSGGTGVGLRNVERRLRTRFGADCRFRATAFHEGGFRVRMELPLRFAS
jgi:two-component system LytT family sensor kinase